MAKSTNLIKIAQLFTRKLGEAVIIICFLELQVVFLNEADASENRA